MITRRQLTGFFVALILLAILGLFGEMDRKDALEERAQYCSMVQQRLWPDYRHIAKKECSIIDVVSNSPARRDG
jgi:hypothetical protein